MGYFANSTEGLAYEETFCSRCVHNNEEVGCPVMLAHLLWNYEECNKPESILHKMIPQHGIQNLACFSFVEAGLESGDIRRFEDERLKRWKEMIRSTASPAVSTPPPPGSPSPPA